MRVVYIPEEERESDFPNYDNEIEERIREATEAFAEFVSEHDNYTQERVLYVPLEGLTLSVDSIRIGTF